MEQIDRCELDGRPKQPALTLFQEEEGGILFLQLPSLYQQWNGSTFGQKAQVGLNQCAMYSLYNLELLQKMATSPTNIKQLKGFLQTIASTGLVPKEFGNNKGIKGPLQKLVNRKQFCSFLRPKAELHASNVLHRLFLASSDKESDVDGYFHENSLFELSSADIYGLGVQGPAILDENLCSKNLDTYGAQYRDLKANIQKLRRSATFGFLLRYDIIDDKNQKMPHYVAVLHVKLDCSETRRACLVVDSLCDDSWQNALKQLLISLL